MEHIRLLGVFICAVVAVSCSKGDAPVDTTIEVSTGASLEVNEISAKVSGIVKYSESIEGQVTYGIEYSTSPFSDAKESSTSGKDKDATGNFICTINNLKPAQEYYYRAYAQYKGERTYGSTKSFSTSDFSLIVTTETSQRLTLRSRQVTGKYVAGTDNDKLTISTYFYFSPEAKDAESLISTGVREFANNDKGSFSATLPGLKAGTTYYYLACVEIGGKFAKGEVLQFTTDACPDNAVDFGLSVFWAKCNLGASKPEEIGDYFSWGETDSKNAFSLSSYKWYSSSSEKYTKYSFDAATGANDKKNILDKEDDPATKLGGSWRMPTYKEMEELYNACNWTWTTVNGVDGYKATGKMDAYSMNELFIPAAGFYNKDGGFQFKGSYCMLWVNSLSSDRKLNTTDEFATAYSFYMGMNSCFSSGSYRFCGLSVRPVMD